MGKLELFMWMPFALAFLLSMGNESFSSFLPVDNYLLACGSTVNVNFQGRTFFPDSVYEQDKLELRSQKSVAVSSYSGAPFPIYNSARVFWSKASYKFRIEQKGRHWIRLYFYPVPHLSLNLSSASITVVTDSFVLLSNFTFIKYGGSTSYLFKEYAINITSPTLVLTFIPSSNSFAFVNAIEVVSIPDDLFSNKPLALNPSPNFIDLSELALETVYRLDVGSESFDTQVDELGRNWEGDDKYLSPSSSALNISGGLTIMYPSAVIPEKAPLWVYSTAKVMAEAQISNLSWVFSVNPNFSYFVRVHFCDMISKSNDSLVFDLFINGGIAQSSIDLSTLTRDLSVPYYMDFLVFTRENTLTVSVTPNTKAKITNATMNGLEIMKITTVDSSLPNLSLPVRREFIVGTSVGAAAFVVLVGITLYYLIVYRSKASSRTTPKSCRHFTLREINDATNNFAKCLLLGEGGFGRVYKGMIDNGIKVAIKVAKRKSRQGLREFQNEIELLSKIFHPNLINLIGYCNEESQMILVYEFLANGSLSGHLYGTNFIPLSWKQRLGICIGAAKGLHHLHTGAPQSIIHRDVKTANILLDENFVPKVADFGISKKGPFLDKSHVTTHVKGSFGYIDPEYFRTKFLTEKSDVFSFGMVLMEVICGKPALDNARPTTQINLTRWALSCQEKGTSHQIIDPNLIGKVNLDSLNKVYELAWKCLEENRINRPPMGYVLCELENALHLELASPTLLVSMDSIVDVDAENGIDDEKEQDVA